MRRETVLAALVALLLVAVGEAAPATPGRWVITDLGTLGGSGSDAYSINDRGQIVGSAETKAGRRHAVLWENGKVRDLGTLGGPNSQAVSINSRGQIVGVSDTKAKGELAERWGHAFLWENGKMRDLGVGPGRVLAINNRGQILGLRFVGKPLPEVQAYLWQNGRITRLGSLGCCGLEPVALNERGQVIGAYTDVDGETGEGNQRAFLWQNGKARDLGALSGEWSEAIAINERGQVVGKSDFQAFLWQNGKMRHLGGDSTEADDINERGQIVGYAVAGQVRGFLWQNGKITYLGTLGGSDTRAYSINERDQIVGASETKATWMDEGIRRRVKHAFLWQNGKMTDLGSLGGSGSQSLAWGNTDRGEIVGESDTGKRYPGGEAISRAVLWTYKP